MSIIKLHHTVITLETMIVYNHNLVHKLKKKYIKIAKIYSYNHPILNDYINENHILCTISDSQ